MESVLNQLTKGFNDVRVVDEEEEEEEEEDEDDSKKQKHIPHDLLSDEILSKLPLKCVLRSKSVSKLWYSTLSSHSFANTHFKLSPFSQPSSPTQFLFIQSGPDSYIYSYHDDDAGDLQILNYLDAQKGLLKLNSNFDVSFNQLFLVGSCNGLVCLASSSTYFLIWNPLTLQFRTILDSFLRDSSNLPSVSWGFGYASSVDDYKVVRIIELHETLEIVVHVFSLRTNEWRRIGAPMYDHVLALTTTEGEDECSFLFETNIGVLVNDTLHWIVYTDEGWGRKIVTFDLNLEVFHDFPHLQLRSTEAFRDDFLCVLGGCLSTWGVNIREDVSIDMLKSPGVKESMTLYRDLNLGACKDAVGFTRTGKFFVIDRYDTQLGLVDRRSSPKKYTRLVSFQSSCDNQIANYVPSLISPFPTGNLLAQ